MNKLPSKITFSQGNTSPSYFELRQKADELVVLLGTQYGLTQEQQRIVRRSIIVVLHKTVPAMFVRDVQAPLDPLVCKKYRERLLAYLQRVFVSSGSPADASQ